MNTALIVTAGMALFTIFFGTAGLDHRTPPRMMLADCLRVVGQAAGRFWRRWPLSLSACLAAFWRSDRSCSRQRGSCTTTAARNYIFTNLLVSSRYRDSAFSVPAAGISGAVVENIQPGLSAHGRAGCFRLTWLLAGLFVDSISLAGQMTLGRGPADSYVISIPLMEGAPPWLALSGFLRRRFPRRTAWLS